MNITAITYCKSGLIILGLLVGLSGCGTKWPREENQTKVYRDNEQLAYDRYTQPILYRRLFGFKGRLYELRHRGAKRCFPGRFQEAELLVQRIERGISGVHLSFAQEDLQELKYQITGLRVTLNKVNVRRSCRVKTLPNQLGRFYRERWA